MNEEFKISIHVASVTKISVLSGNVLVTTLPYRYLYIKHVEFNHVRAIIESYEIKKNPKFENPKSSNEER